MPLAAATVVTSSTYSDKAVRDFNKNSVIMHRVSLVAGNGDTHDTGAVAIKEAMIAGTANVPGASGNIAISGISGGTVTFSAAGSTLFDLVYFTGQ